MKTSGDALVVAVAMYSYPLDQCTCIVYWPISYMIKWLLTAKHVTKGPDP